MKPLTNLDIIEICKVLKINNFKGVYMRDELKGKANPNESLILNMDESSGNGTHWTCLFVTKNCSYYFDSFGLPPPKEVISYCPNTELYKYRADALCSEAKPNTRYYNTFKIQKPEEVICGHYCIYVLYKLSNSNKRVSQFYNICFQLLNTK